MASLSSNFSSINCFLSNAMIKLRSYSYKKIYLKNQIFEEYGREVKIGYLNVNGLIDGNHAEYIDKDRNLLQLDILVLAETKLSKSI